MRIMITEHDTIETLQKAISKTDDKRYRRRLRTIILAKKGVSAVRIQKEVAISPKTYYLWLHRYNDGGMQALKETRTPGRSEGNPKYDDAIFMELFERLKEDKTQWTIMRMQAFVKTLHGVDVPYETMRMRVKRAGL